MAITEEDRHLLYARLQEILGPEEARVLMEHLPPIGWADVATKRDLDLGLEGLRAYVDGRFDTMEARFDARIERSMREVENRFTLKVGAILTLLVAVQAVIQQLAG